MKPPSSIQTSEFRDKLAAHLSSRDSQSRSVSR
uniref:Cdk-associated protein phosphatase mutant k6 n=1 Tax=Homo sapiens TaxID=9606 RepID=Q86SK4_HUMAN|nr:Cdk-associated protein phosphatase mutant k6 [Homo sapiens]